MSCQIASFASNTVCSIKISPPPFNFLSLQKYLLVSFATPLHPAFEGILNSENLSPFIWTMMALPCRTVRASRAMFKHHVFINCIASTSPYPRLSFQNILHHESHNSRRLASNSALFNLGGLSTSRESQYLAKELRMPRTEFSPHLELIRSSEVDTQVPRNLHSGKSPSSTKVAEMSAAKDIKAGQLPTTSVAVDGAKYAIVNGKIKILQQKLDASERAVQQHLLAYRRKIRRWVVFGGLCFLLSAATGRLTGLYDIHLGNVQAWLLGRKMEQPVQEKPEVQLEPANTEHINTVSTIAALGATPGQDAETTRPWLSSRLFWAAKSEGQ